MASPLFSAANNLNRLQAIGFNLGYDSLIPIDFCMSNAYSSCIVRTADTGLYALMLILLKCL